MDVEANEAMKVEAEEALLHLFVCIITNHMEASKMMNQTCMGLPSLSRKLSSKTLHNLHRAGVRQGWRRGNPVIVAASPPTEEAVTTTEPLTKEDLVGFLGSGCKPKELWR
ncbi:unnamed protein product [Ilex paraguariensis]|uniref:Uncharacterized protein n=1 Tax=Ilex paraguariensis TaxID=185542 RepID=A0ABC8RBB0_9AQUA